MKSIELIATYAYGTSKDLVSEKEEIQYSYIIKRNKKMINIDDIGKEDIKEHNPNQTQTSNYPYRILIIGGSESGKNKFIV